MSAILKHPEHKLTNLIDEFSELYAECKAFEPKQKRFDELRKILSSHCDEINPGDAVRLTGRFGYAEFTKATETRIISNIPEVFKALGTQNFLSCCKISVTAAEKYLSKVQQSELFELEKGVRRLKAAGPLGAGIFSDLERALRAVK